MTNYLNIIQVVTGIIAVAFIFTGLFLSVKKLNKEDSTTKIPEKTIKLSVLLIVIGLLFYSVTKTCTNYANRDQEYDLIVIYMASLIDVIKFFGFIALIPIVLNFVKRKPKKKAVESED